MKQRHKWSIIEMVILVRSVLLSQHIEKRTDQLQLCTAHSSTPVASIDHNKMSAMTTEAEKAHDNLHGMRQDALVHTAEGNWQEKSLTKSWNSSY